MCQVRLHLHKGRYFYRDKRRHFTKTQRAMVAMGERRRPQPNGQPGYLRIDTVHQGDQDQINCPRPMGSVEKILKNAIFCDF